MAATKLPNTLDNAIDACGGDKDRIPGRVRDSTKVPSHIGTCPAGQMSTCTADALVKGFSGMARPLEEFKLGWLDRPGEYFAEAGPMIRLLKLV